ncbi:tyrosine-protein phosphatase [Georgenia ruanii]|uniref:Protein-tyrosine-phosphatase n=1 Tax=Georgenia ruanii TaxID=348442 RepID=A0A7J9V1U4_9MICO|nr:tyrosine-protein phosphatase [Georgenia ruanii]MPV90563.1 protein-tyrosine-phosphatase [Georgenia ruanii]
MTIDNGAALKLDSVPNFRDIAGPGYRTSTGRMRRGRLFRANSFLVTAEELERLAPLGLMAVHDLRGQGEVDLRPDTVPRGATWRHSWVPGLSRDTVRTLETSAALRDAMINHYRGFVVDANKRAGFAHLLAGIAEVDGPQVFHCWEGKDRTGWAAMLLQTLAGVSHDDIVADFLLTNELMQRTGPTLELARRFFGNRPDEFFAPAMDADVAYLEAGLEQLEATHGDVETYLRTGLELDDDQLVKLRAHLIE